MPGSDDHRHLVAYLRELQRFGTPEEFGELLRQIGTAQQAGEFHEAISRVIEREERVKWLWQSLKAASGIFLGVGGAIILLRDVLPLVLRLLSGAP